jgi:hypothetical protein
VEVEVIGYGSFPGGDPRRFSPDPECSTEAERDAHRVACARWDAGYRDEYPTHALYAEGGAVVHVNRSAFGLGVYDDGRPECERCHDSGCVDTGEPSDAGDGATKWKPCPECEAAL